jgi:two-component system cell cycle sensor histidine kinase/response regulator CckA
MTIEDICPPEDREALRRSAAAAPTGPLAPTMLRHLKKDGTLIDVETSTNTVEFEGRPVRLVLAQDVTERRRLEEHVRQAQKMDAVGNLAGGIAHDFNNTLTVIRATVDLLVPTVEDEETRERIRQIELAAEHATTLTRQLLAFGRVQVLHPKPIDLNLVVEESLDLAARLLGDHIAVKRTLESPLPPVLADRGQLQQVILNLAINARDAMPDGGTLTVRTRRVELDERYTAGELDLEPGRYLLIEITDTGIGMDTEMQGRIFDPFFTTKKEGTGLGLATVYGIVKQSGGHVTVYSEPGHGTTFKIYLPPADSPSEPVAPARPSLETIPQGNETILLVEDAELLRPLTTEVLTNYGYTVLAAANGEDALAAASAHPGRIDLLLTDVVMPGINGRELAEQLLQTRPELRVIFTSGYPSDSIVRRGIATADVAFIQKPYLARDLVAEIRTVLDS